ncbi:hypothetical protein JCGZ_14923 [Jatropha curcas]|uniref:Kazal-like domain-containing protein n=1 Tax=Jatropha curcas TaxID=180498 RepID=A0A067LBZ8_JATCU|nr:uncharacterized protein LOC105636214 [Jatropha curcas]KDP46016.1 hypothetical protein JCGZ_14923 [Jatropha curcas]
MIQIPFPFSDSELRMPIVFFLILSLCFISGIHSESVIQLPTDRRDIYDVDPCSGSEKPASCPVKCFRTDPVCGADGVTYWCGCGEARCAGTKVVKKGFCEVGNNGAAAQAMLLLHIVWLIVLGLSVLFGLF